MKQVFIILFLFVIVILTGCKTESSDIELAREVADDFLYEVYTINDHNSLADQKYPYFEKVYRDELKNVEIYFTENGYMELQDTWYIYGIIFNSYFKELNIEVLDIEYDLLNTEKNGCIAFDYSVKLQLEFTDRESEVIHEEGKICLIEEETWRIDHILKEVVQGESLDYAIDEIENVIDYPEKISVFSDDTSMYFAGGRAYAIASKEQKEQLSEWLAKIELSCGIVFDGRNKVIDEEFLPIEELLIENEGKEYRLMMIVGKNNSYLSLQEADWYLHPEESMLNIIHLRCDVTAVPSLSEFNNITSAVLDDTSDTQNCAVITVLNDSDTSFPAANTNYAISKWHTAVIENILEGIISNTNPVESIEENYNLQIDIGKTTYLLNTEKGLFTRDSIGPYAIEDMWKRKMIPRLHYSGNNL